MEGYHSLNFQNSDYNYNINLNNNVAAANVKDEVNEKLNLDKP